MPLCGFNQKMIEGIATFSEGLFEATTQRGQDHNMDSRQAVEMEIHEIDLFVQALKDRYKTPDKVTKKMAEMIYGIAVFSGGLFESTVDQCDKQNTDLQLTYKQQVGRISTFLEQLEKKHQELKQNHTPEETMVKAVDWIDENDL